jgi:CxxC motif-containing protein (DUF1111 family)
MRWNYLAWYLLITLGAAAPVGIRVLTWSGTPEQPLDPMAVQAGQDLFLHVWTPHDPLARGGDGLGPVYNANSCVACHHQGGPGGSGGLQHNVTVFTVAPQRPGDKPREGVVHKHGAQYQETLRDVHPDLPPLSQPTLAQLVPMAHKGRPQEQLIPFPPGVHISQRNTPALFGAKLIDEIPERLIIANERRQRLKWGLSVASADSAPVGRALRLPDGRVGRFGWKAQSASLSDFVQAACANELGLGNPGQAQPRPLGKPDYQAPGLDLTLEQCNQMTAFIGSLPRPEQRLPDEPAAKEKARAGQKLFHNVGCANCHTPDVGSAEGVYSDLLLHHMGEALQGSGSYNEPPQTPRTPPSSTGDGPQPDEWRTPPLWGVADSAPYLHDGRAATLKEAIELHAGQGARSARHFATLSPADQGRLIAFLKTLRAPAPADRGVLAKR